MKKILSVLMTLVCLVLVMSCGTPGSDSFDDDKSSYSDDDKKTDSNDSIEFKAGWWKTTSNLEIDTYIFFDNEKKITRAGNKEKEFFGNDFKEYKNITFDYVKSLVIQNNMKFVTITESNLPAAWLSAFRPGWWKCTNTLGVVYICFNDYKYILRVGTNNEELKDKDLQDMQKNTFDDLQRQAQENSWEFIQITEDDLPEILK